MKIITNNKSISSFLIALRITLLLTVPQQKHFVNLVQAFMMDGFKGKTSNVAELCHVRIHRTSIGHYLNDSPWADDIVKQAYNKYVLRQIQSLSISTGQAVYVIADDTVSEKTKPSSKAKCPTQKCVFVYSHLKKKQVYGHQFVGVMLECAGQRFPYYLELYEKTKQGKIGMVIEVIEKLPSMSSPVFVMADSWYSSNKLIKVCRKKGFHYVGGFKTNRVIYPKGKRMSFQISGYAKTLTSSDVHLVTVGKRKYWVHRYEGKLNNLPKGVVLLCWPEDALFKEEALHAFISTIALTDEEILNTYAERWTIEVFFRDCKMQLKLNKYQIRSEKGIRRFMLLLSLSCVFSTCFVESSHPNPTIGNKRFEARKEIDRCLVDKIYSMANSGLMIEDIYYKLNIANW
jgi:hypothetical protein